jgi:hypothetical protein
MPELDPTGGMAEKIVPLVRFPILMRVMLPGGLITAFIYPFIMVGYPAFAIQLNLPWAENWKQLAIVGAMVFVFGALASAVNGEVYKIYEGRILWPRRLLELAVVRQQFRLDRQIRRRNEAKQAGRTTEYGEAWYQLRLYPTDTEGKQYVKRPTLLGNILAGYEDYPDKRYGMDSVFFWPRLWLQLEKETKEEIDNSWSVADGFLSLSAISSIGGVVWLLVGALNALDVTAMTLPFSDWGILLAGMTFLVVGYGFYRLSLPFHRQNGELFKSVFDLYRDKIWSLTSLKPNEVQIWDSTWSYLQYLQVPCKGTLQSGAKCDKWVVAGGKECPQCGTPVCQSVAELINSGQFPRR